MRSDLELADGRTLKEMMVSQALSPLNGIYLFLALKGSQKVADSRYYFRSESYLFQVGREVGQSAG